MMATTQTLTAYAAAVKADPREHCQHCGYKFTPGDVCTAESIGRPLGRSLCRAQDSRRQTRELAETEHTAALQRACDADMIAARHVNVSRALTAMAGNRAQDDPSARAWRRSAAAHRSHALRNHRDARIARADAADWHAIATANAEPPATCAHGVPLTAPCEDCGDGPTIHAEPRGE